ncbi:hypothetical protein NECAME_07778 [Necator americanus]|uniref:Uncharacterized protein n=1 Tax=Necator americanus TaxID=51031 RepID=W2TM15_NECAM|nr:hypothetical protein NECAME_07778 [Necator americanus]ETN82773.1 hypothetical protein NECAME_07778 [Necator americanus]
MISRRPGTFGALKVTRNGLSKRLVQRVMLTLKTTLTPTSRTERSLAKQSYLPDLLKTSPRCEFLEESSAEGNDEFEALYLRSTVGTFLKGRKVCIDANGGSVLFHRKQQTRSAKVVTQESEEECSVATFDSM